MAKEDIPNNLAKVMVYSCSMTVIITGSGLIDYSLQPVQHNLHNKFWESWNCKYHLEGNTQELRHAIMTGQAVVVSNGSFQSAAGMAAWMIEGQTAEHQLHGTGKTPGNESDHSAYQSELFGI